jgi:hypothetical protein
MKAIQTRYIGPTDFRCSRIKAFDSDGNSVTIPYPHDLSHENTHAAAALALARKMGWKGTLVRGGIKGGEVFCFLASDKYEI